MSDGNRTQFDRGDSVRYVYDPDAQPELFDGVLSKRVVAFVVDAILIVLLMIPAAWSSSSSASSPSASPGSFPCRCSPSSPSAISA